MPLTDKGERIMKEMKDEYGPKKGREVFYAAANKGTITGVHKKDDSDGDDKKRSSKKSGTGSKKG